MAKISFVLADTDERYLDRVTGYLQERGSGYAVASFSSADSLQRFLHTAGHIDILAVTEPFAAAAAAASGVGVKLLLVAGLQLSALEWPCVNKYQRTEKLLQEILLLHAEATGRQDAFDAQRDTRLVAFFSPVGGSGKTTLAVATAAALAQAGKRVLFFSAERLNSTASIFCRAPSGSLSDVYLAVKTRGANPAIRVLANCYADPETGITYLNPAESSLELNELSSAELGGLLTAVDGLHEFDAVVVDLDGECSAEKIELLQCFDRIILPFTADRISLSKASLFARELELYEEGQALAGKLRWVLSKSDGRSIPLVQASGLAERCAICANIPLTPLLAELETLLHAGAQTAQLVQGILSALET